ncbi:MAG: glycosyltransferase family 39 protein [bacterium]|nr:glycosyltransferase family 39 protein [bacterium]
MNFFAKHRVAIALIGIVIIGAGFRLWNLGSAELTFDEGLYAFRSIGYLDYLESAAQPTPVHWFENNPLPWWTKLSFHDHPPLFFLIQHICFAMLGDSLLVARIPSALAGIASILLIFFVVRRLFKNIFPELTLNGLSPMSIGGLIAAALISVNFAHVFISRLAMMESVLIALSLLNILTFLRFMENPRRWIAFGATFGLVLLTKYVGIFLMPAYLAVIALQQPALFKNWRMYAAALLAAILFAPVVIYNIMLYKTFGHFDLQFSYLFGKMPPYWQGDSGKTQESFSRIFMNLRALYSPLLLILGTAGVILATGARRAIPTGRQARNALSLVLFTGASITFLLIAVGSAPRFTALYIISIIPLASFAILRCTERFPKREVLTVALGIIIASETVFTVKAQFTDTPNYGVVQLDRYLDGVFGSARPVNVPRHPSPTLDSVIQTYARNIPATIPPSGIIYDDNLAVGPMLWLFSRRQYYHGIPIMPASVFLEAQKTGNTAMFKNVALYFVKAENGAPLKRAHVGAAENIEKIFIANKNNPQFTAADDAGRAAFKAYRFTVN